MRCCEQADLAIFGVIPQGFLGEPLMRMRFILAAHPDHPLHRLGRRLTVQDLRAHRQLVVRESSPRRSTPLTLEATQRWTVGNLATSIEAARSGHGFAWLPEDRIREELEAGTLKALPLRDGGERFAESVPDLRRPRARRTGDVAAGRNRPRERWRPSAGNPPSRCSPRRASGQRSAAGRRARRPG